MSRWLVVLVGAVGGLAAALQSQALGFMENRVGTLASTFVNFGVGAIIIGTAMLAFGGGKWAEVRLLPWWAFTAGVMSLVIVASLGITVSRLGLSAGITLFTAATLVLGAIVDHLGWFGQPNLVDFRRLAGVAIVIFGTWIVVGSPTTPPG